jgi:hypothetical protein
MDEIIVNETSISDTDAVEMHFASYGVSFSIIKNEHLRNAVLKYFVDTVPKYFWHVQASSTGKYHPQYALGEEGLLRHTCAAVRIAAAIINLDQYNGIFDDVDKDNIIVALMLHDTFKHGEEKDGKYNPYSIHEHPLLAAEKVSERLDDEHKCVIANCIASHMGEWTESNRSHYVLPKPKTLEEQMVHLCDYLASRKFLEFKF